MVRFIISLVDFEKCVKIMLMFVEKIKCIIYKYEKGEVMVIEELVMLWIEVFKSLFYFGIFLVFCIEFIFVEIVLLFVGYWVFKGDMIFFGVVLVGFFGGVVGLFMLYWIGWYGGRLFFECFGKYFFIKFEVFDKLDEFFKKYGGFVVFSGCFLSGIWILIFILCGIVKMNVWVFLFYMFIVMLLIIFVYVYFGVKFGENWKEVGFIFD